MPVKKISTKDMALCAMFVALNAVLSQIQIPIGPVPINLTHVSVFLAVGLLGTKLSTITQVVFVVMGAVGLPVFSGFHSGMDWLIGPTGGFIIAYIFTALLSGFIMDHWSRKSIFGLTSAIYAGWILTYAFGTAWYTIYAHTNFLAALSICVLPFLPGDAAKTILLVPLIQRLRPLLTKEKTNMNWDHLKREDGVGIFAMADDELPNLIDRAFTLRQKYKGNTVRVQLLTNAKSGDCSQNCAYCAQSHVSGADIEKYTFVEAEKLLEDGQLIQEKHLARHCIGLSGIAFSDSEIERFAQSVRQLKQEYDTPICCSIGFLTEKQARTLKDAGVDRINHNLNTGRNHYPNICSTHTYQQRVDNIQMLQKLGFEICCGGIIGLGETKEDILDMLFELQELHPQAVPINFLIPIDKTPLEHADTSHLTPEYCLKILALARLLIPQADIRAAAGREVYLKGRERDMFKIVDSIFASGYLTASGQGIDETLKQIEQAGFSADIE